LLELVPVTVCSYPNDQTTPLAIGMKSFFLRFPREIRDKIYEFACEETIDIHPEWELHTLIGARGFCVALENLFLRLL